jgi:formate dehydrogenase subunit gamma
VAEAVFGGRLFRLVDGQMEDLVRTRETRAAPPRVVDPSIPSADLILRFRTSERLLHWSIAAPFVVCWLTALVLVFRYNPHPNLPLRALFSWTHRLSGVCLIVFPLLTAVRHRDDLGLHWRNVAEAWRVSIDDVKWLALTGPATFFKHIVLPEQGKFNGGEKLNFMMVNVAWPVFTLTGLLIWLPGVAFYAWIAHVSMAAVATPFVLGHVFMATINPDTKIGLSGMISGYVDRHWARHHYTKWYRELFGAEDGSDAGRGFHDAPAGMSEPVEVSRSFPGVAARPVASPTALVVDVLPGAEPACSSCAKWYHERFGTQEEADVESQPLPLPTASVVEALPGRGLACSICGAAVNGVSARLEPDVLGPVFGSLAEAEERVAAAESTACADRPVSV